ncbi:hypothetical protein PGT21_011260 [Puccinia graminis f. sp. tritici]|uniref:Uncharacterized protein n=1 Tax=Puccinia graminis f. sp. tritici TaxID=56615 RepID=A0A5B0MNE3_PUCGR|nr:hypothetical protein PGT21_011260 [Puccinia graminis f. sp. tritici]
MYIYHALNILTLSPKEKCNNKGTAPVPAAELTPAISVLQLHSPGINRSPNHSNSYHCTNSLSPKNCINMSSQSQPKTTAAKTYSEAVSASEGTRSKPSKQSRTTPKKPKKQFKSPEVVPSEWDRDSDSSAKKGEPRPPTVPATKPAKAVVKAKKISTSAKVDQTQTKENDHPNKVHPTDTREKKNNQLDDPSPQIDPFKSNEKISKLIDKDSISHLTFKKLDQSPPKDIVTDSPSKPITKNASDQSSRNVKPPSSVNSVSEAAKILLNGPKTFNEPVDRSTQKKLDNYFVPQGRTVRSVSSRSSDHPDSSHTSSSSVIQSDGSDLDIITGAIAQLWSRHKTLPAPLEEDTLLRYPPAYHPLLQAVKLNQEYYRRAKKTNNESLKVVALRAAANLQTNLLHSISQEEFLKLFNWNPTSEFEEYSNGEKGRQFLKKRGTEVTPTPPPEVQMQPPEAERSHPQPQDQPAEHQPQSQMYYHPNGYYYPYQPMNQPAQNQCWPQQGYNQEYSTYQQGYYPPQQWVNNQTAQAETPIPPQQTGKKESDQATKSNRSRPNNRKAKGPNWIPPPTLKRSP